MARLTPDKCIFLVCDVQERFRSAIHNFPAVVAGSQRMLKAAIELKIPTIVTEQYPKGLGKTVEELDVSRAELFEKTTFTMLCPAVAARLAEHEQVTDFVVVGIEAHVCVQQTTLDLLEKGFNVHLCVDALSSSTPVDRACGLHRAECAAPTSAVTHAHTSLIAADARGVAGVRAPTSPRRKVCSWILSAAKITRASRRSQPTSRRPSWRSRLDFSDINISRRPLLLLRVMDNPAFRPDSEALFSWVFH
jgi:nicotinamidase-related amidase